MEEKLFVFVLELLTTLLFYFAKVLFIQISQLSGRYE